MRDPYGGQIFDLAREFKNFGKNLYWNLANHGNPSVGLSGLYRNGSALGTRTGKISSLGNADFICGYLRAGGALVLEVI